MSILRVGILYCTFSRDVEWLDFSLQSVRKYASGFSGITIVVPTNDLDVFIPLEKKYSAPDCPVLIKTFLEFPGKGFLHHEAMICSSDIFMSSMTHILHLDPDCLITAPITPLDYMVDGKPVLLIEPYEAIKLAGHDGRYGWKAVTETALRFDCTHETMCRHPAVHHKWLYKELRDHMEREHQIPFIDFVLRQKNSFPQGFGEFNTLGAYAVKFHADKYHLIDRGFTHEKADPAPKVWQGWSYQGVSANMGMISKILS